MIVVGSVRPGRIGLPIAEWVRGVAAERGFEIDFADLAESGLLFRDEPTPPRLRKYTRQHTLDWSARVSAAEGFVFVTPEYNHSFSPALKNAIDFLSQEWWRKPVAFVSYGGGSGGPPGVGGPPPAIPSRRLGRTRSTRPPPLPGQHGPDGGVPPGRQQNP